MSRSPDAAYKLDENFFMKLKIDDTFLPEVSSFVGKVSMKESILKAVPELFLELKDLGNIFQDEYVLSDNNKFEISMSKNSEDLTKESKKCRFSTFSYKGVPGGEGYSHNILCLGDYSKYIAEAKLYAKKGTSTEIIEDIAKFGGMKFKNIKADANDAQNWLNPGDSMSKFAKKIIDHSYKKDGSLLSIGVSANGHLIMCDIAEKINSGIDKTMIYGGDGEGDEITVDEVNFYSNTGFPNNYVGYGFRLTEPLMDGYFKEDTAIDFTSNERYLSINDIEYYNMDYVRHEHSPHQNGNTHKNYWKAYHNNLRISSLFSQSVVCITRDVTGLKLYDTVKLKFSKMFETDNIMKNKSGKYIVVSKKSIIKGMRYSELIMLVRAGINEAGRAFLLMEDGKDSPERVQVKQGDAGKSKWTWEGPVKDDVDRCNDLWMESPMPNTEDSSIDDNEEFYTDEYCDPYEEALTNKRGEPNTTSDPCSKFSRENEEEKCKKRSGTPGSQEGGAKDNE